MWSVRSRARVLSARPPLLFDVATAYQILSSLARHANVAVTILNTVGDRFVEPLNDNDAPLCKVIKATESGKRLCRACELSRLLETVRRNPAVAFQRCHAGLPTVAIGAVQGEQASSGVLLSGFLTTAPDDELFRLLGALGSRLGISLDALGAAAVRMPIVSADRVRALAESVYQATREFRCASDRQQAIFDVCDEVLNSPSLDRSLRSIVAGARHVVGSDVSLGVFVLDPLSHKLTFRAGTGVGPGDQPIETAVDQRVSLNVGEGMTGWVAQERQLRYEPDVYAPHAVHLSRPIRTSTRSEVDVPLIYQGRLVGVLNADSTLLDGFSEPELHTLTLVARYAAAAIGFSDTTRKVSLFTEVLHHCEDDDQLIKALLLASTTQSGLRCDRAGYFEVSSSQSHAYGRSAIGTRIQQECAECIQLQPAESDECARIVQRTRDWRGSYFDEQIYDTVLSPMKVEQNAFRSAIVEKRAQLVSMEPGSQEFLRALRKLIENNDELREYLGRADQFMVVPVSAGTGAPVLGLLYADNAFTGRPVADADLAVAEVLARNAAFLLTLTAERRRLRELEHSSRSAEFFRTAHHLCNPLQTLLVTCEQCLAVIHDGTDRDTVANSLRNLQSTIEAFVELWRAAEFDPARTTPQPEACDIRRVLTRLRDVYRPKAEEREIALAVEGDHTSVEAFADTRAVYAILSTLIDNSIEYTEPGGHVRVSWGTDESKAKLVATVEDDGIGIEAGIALDELTPGTRGARASIRNPAGHGQGLCDARAIANANQLALTVTRRSVGSGTLATLLMPRRMVGLDTRVAQDVSSCQTSPNT